ncbi:hypothetical protein GLAREA_02930 [Glarea lozoyensis ATCC 20868]|uniref:DUF8004 domain-containing protein n=1 Tax=Glarea lozoyensis (strain ATCC 20868 / MF5171) TaxID=1116229 RepID=S3D4L3_GLAL2|nr:uncharacterized protein GLAREA_02930 [Glarea lozoyensis ATCC 20868]EPE27016.1 hypothetical protein GLAREA_02930 [Glarea lozoyensis ATCC 20868]
MSGRSAHVRKEKTKVKHTEVSRIIGSDGGSVKGDSLASPTSISDFPLPVGSDHHNFQQELSYRTANDYNTIKTVASGGSGGTDDLAYARVRKPQVPIIDVSGIEKSSFRSMMDKRSEGVRKGLAKTFGKKKKIEEPRPATAATVRPGSHELDTGEYIPQPTMGSRSTTRQNQFSEPQDYMRAAPAGKLPAVPPQLKRWMGSGRAPQPWNKLRKDPELWDPNGDTLVFFSHEGQQASRPPPSFRLSSHVLEATDSRYLITLLREGFTDEESSFSMPPSPVNAPPIRNGHSMNRFNPTPPMSDNSLGTYDGQISYEIYFPPPNNQSKIDILRHQVTTRNVFALLYQASLVGLNLFQALNDLHERLEVYMPPDSDAAGMIIDYLISKGIDDVRENPAAAMSLLAWSESQGVRWEEGWRESFVHCCGMHKIKYTDIPDYRFVTTITKALLDRASIQIQERVHECEGRLSDFDFGDMWPMMTAQPPPARTAFERLRTFFLQHYQLQFESWPPLPRPGDEQWLDRNMTARLQTDFGALYDYLVNREVAWDCSEERSGRKWNIVHPNNRGFDADTPDLPFTDLLVAFDNRLQYPHIPHPYPLTPESSPAKSNSTRGKPARPGDDRMAERRAALAYTESTNIYLFGSEFVINDLVDAFMRFEKSDRQGDVDPHAARRGRWILIYGILQTLASISVDTPNLRYKEGISYHLNPKLNNTPPWKGANQNVAEANHSDSYCWIVRESWNAEQTPTALPRVKPLYIKNYSAPASVADSDNSGSSFRSPTMSSISVRSPTMNSTSTRSRTARNRKTPDSDNTSYSGYGPGIEKVDEWPMREQSREKIREQSRNRAIPPQPQHYTIKDFDDYHF